MQLQKAGKLKTSTIKRRVTEKEHPGRDNLKQEEVKTEGKRMRRGKPQQGCSKKSMEL